MRNHAASSEQHCHADKKRIYMEVVELNFSFGWPVMSQLIF